jgi:hypothetical protein
MKTVLLVVLGLAGLAGCVAVPVEPRPYVVAPVPPPVVVVRPAFGYWYAPGWHRRWH